MKESVKTLIKISLVLVIIVAIILIILSLCPVIEEEVDKKEFYKKTSNLYTVQDLPDDAEITYILEYPSQKDGSGYTSILSKPFTDIDKYTLTARRSDVVYEITYGQLLVSLSDAKSFTFYDYQLDYAYRNEEENYQVLIMQYKEYSISITYYKQRSGEQISQDITTLLKDFFDIK